jgi:transposase-like protein
MVKTAVKCPVCKSTKISRNGKTETGTQRYLCNDKECPEKSFLIDYIYNGRKPGIDEIIINMAANAFGIRDTSRVPAVSKQKVSDTLKKQKNQSAESIRTT